jgi:hypothetical protein
LVDRLSFSTAGSLLVYGYKLSMGSEEKEIAAHGLVIVE